MWAAVYIGKPQQIEDKSFVTNNPKPDAFTLALESVSASASVAIETNANRIPYQIRCCVYESQYLHDICLVFCRKFTYRFAMDWMHGKYNAGYNCEIILQTGHYDAHSGE